ncbi:BTB/POZ protein [Dichotomocladium elegans]|nr:BTB/POZ protein [Dichotomocladium elegans]
MERSDSWPSNDPHSPTHQSPKSPHRTLTELACDYKELGPQAPNRNHHHRRRLTFLFDDSEGPRQQPLPLVGNEDSATTTTASSTEPDESLLANELPLEMGFRSKSLDEVEQIRSSLSSLNTSTNGTDIWDGYQIEYKKIGESYRQSQQDIFRDIQYLFQELKSHEQKWERTKEVHQNKMSMEYRDLNKALTARMRRIDQRESSFKKALDTSNHGDSVIFSSAVVKLNVGGEIFETKIDTLRKDENSLLAMMFSGRHQMVSDETDGSYFIDRDPTHFRNILNYLRGKKINFNLQDKSKCQQLLQEARYYRIDELVKSLERHLQISAV